MFSHAADIANKALSKSPPPPPEQPAQPTTTAPPAGPPAVLPAGPPATEQTPTVEQLAVIQVIDKIQAMFKAEQKKHIKETLKFLIKSLPINNLN